MKKWVIVRFVTIFLIFIPIPLILSGVYIYRNEVNMLITNNTNKNLQLTEQIAKKIDDNILRHILTASSITNENSTYNGPQSIIDRVNILRTLTNEADRLALRQQIDSDLNYLFNYTIDLTGITFVYKDNQYYSFNNRYAFEPSPIKLSSWYQEMVRNNEHLRVLGKVNDSLFSNVHSDEQSLAIATLVNNPNHQYTEDNEVELIFITFKDTAFEKEFFGLQLSQVGRLDILSESGDIVYSKDDQVEPIKKSMHFFTNNYGWQIYKSNKDQLLMTYYTVPSTRWKVINTTSLNELTQNINQVISVVVTAFSFILLVFMIVFFTSIYRTLLRPIHKLIHHMSSLEENNFKGRLQLSGYDEVAKLYKKFNKMVEHINLLILRIDREKDEKLQLELQALQYQVNPHFLLNTLNSISMMADIYGAQHIKKMTTSLSTLLVNTLSKGGMHTPLEEEFNTLSSYADIMKLRYGDRFEVILVIEPSAQELYILRLLLQPLVENSILHGMGDIYKKLNIHVNAKRNGPNLELSVNDDGVGMTKSQIETLLKHHNEKNSGFNHIGIHNVNKRIKLNFGEEYGLEIYSDEESGTQMKLILPAITRDMITSAEGDIHV
ncbi:sensor histidine kinase [Paenibacillus prosopidis]|nr:sensor histidine kinase [Paenibacillus prosopidis]